MRLNLTIAAAALSLLVGVVVWALQPTQKAFSWVATVHLDYLAGFVPGRSGLEPGAPPPNSMLDYDDALASLGSSVTGPYHAFGAMGTLGRRLVLEDGASHPLFFEQFVTPGFYGARQVGARHGRLPDPAATDEIVLGHQLAREMFPDPANAVGMTVTLAAEHVSQRAVIVGVLEPSPAQNPVVDVDMGVAAPLGAYFSGARAGLAAMLPLHLNIVFHDEADAERLSPRIETWVEEYFGPQGEMVRTTELMSEGARAELEQTSADVAARRVTFIAFGLLLAAAALCALYAQAHFRLLRQRQLLGVEKALGATRKQLAVRLVVTQLPWGVLGGLLGWAGLWSLYDLLPRVFLTRPPAVVLLTSLAVPIVALLALTAIVSLPLLTSSAMELLRGRLKGDRVRPILRLVYGGLALALAGGLTASQVHLQVQREIAALERQFGGMYALQTGSAHIDDRLERSFEGPGSLDPTFTVADAHSLAKVPGVRAATVAQALPNLGVSLDSRTERLRATAAGPGYLELMGLALARGDAGGCVLSQAAADGLTAGVGSTLTLAGLTDPVPCEVTGIMRDPHELWSWLVIDLPELIVPPLDGIGLPLPGYTAQPFRSIRVLLELSGSDAEEAVTDWLAANHPGAAAEVITYAPDVEQLLSSLSLQAQLFLLIASLAAALSVWGIVGGFLALLDAERFRIALDRALGLTMSHMRRQWWVRTAGLGLASAAIGVAGGYLLSARLYNALALDIPNLPSREALGLSPTLLLAVAALLLALSTALTLIAARWLARQSTLTLLKEGA